MANKKTKKKTASKKEVKKVVKTEKVEKVKEDKQIKPVKKEAKQKTIEKARRELVYADSRNNDEITNLIKIVLVVTAVVLLVYAATTIITRKLNAKKLVNDSKSNTTIQYDSLIIGSMLNLDGEYYVLIRKSDDEHLSEYDTLKEDLSANENSPKIYTANLDSSFNKRYLADEPSYDSDLTTFRVTGTTLVKVSDKKIQNVYDNYEDILNKLQDLK